MQVRADPGNWTRPWSHSRRQPRCERRALSTMRWVPCRDLQRRRCAGARAAGDQRVDRLVATLGGVDQCPQAGTGNWRFLGFFETAGSLDLCACVDGSATLGTVF
ncbi:hypothetical protein XAB3213_2260009 [Xanthomonas citri pv. bilvae]|nr:hypothetical protein XAB3213_2260009 [Xanthomonas citri pv. bilvae]